MEHFRPSAPQFWTFGASSSGRIGLSGLGFATVIAILLSGASTTTNSNNGSGLAGLALPALLFIAMYFVLIRPNQRRQKEAKARAAALVSSIAVGDEVETTSGIYGFISEIEEDVFWLDIADGHEKERIEIRVNRNAIARKVVQSGETDGAAKQ